jgi:hypothetical protein
MNRFLPAGLLALAACSNELERPTPPNLDGLAATYADVTGTLDARTAPLLLQAGAEKLGFVGDAQAMLDLIFGVFDDVGNLDNQGEAPIEVEGEGLSITRSALTGDEIDISAGAWGIYVRRCPGWVGDAENKRGSLRMTLLFTEEGLEPVIWGQMRQCRIEAGKLQLNGELSVKLEGIENGFDQGIQSLLIKFAGDYASDGPLERVAFDARVLPGDALVTTVELETGERFLVGFGFDGSVRVVDTTGPWSCTESACTGPDAREVRF